MPRGPDPFPISLSLLPGHQELSSLGHVMFYPTWGPEIIPPLKLLFSGCLSRQQKRLKTASKVVWHFAITNRPILILDSNPPHLPKMLFCLLAPRIPSRIAHHRTFIRRCVLWPLDYDSFQTSFLVTILTIWGMLVSILLTGSPLEVVRWFSQVDCDYSFWRAITQRKECLHHILVKEAAVSELLLTVTTSEGVSAWLLPCVAAVFLLLLGVFGRRVACKVQT